MKREEQGTAIIEFVWLAILLLVPLIYIVITVFEVQRTAYAVTTASRSATRAYVTSPDEASAPGRARAAARLAFRDQGIDGSAVGVQLRCRPDPRNCLSPGSVVIASIDTAVPLPLLPTALGGNTPRIRVSSVHQSPYGTFREDRQ